MICILKRQGGGLVRTSGSTGLVTPMPSRGAARGSSPRLASPGPPHRECPQPGGRGGPEPLLWPREPAQGSRVPKTPLPDSRKPRAIPASPPQPPHRQGPHSLQVGRGSGGAARVPCEPVGRQNQRAGLRCCPRSRDRRSHPRCKQATRLLSAGPAPATAPRARKLSVSTTMRRWPPPPVSPKTLASPARRNSAMSSRPV